MVLRALCLVHLRDDCPMVCYSSEPSELHKIARSSVSPLPSRGENNPSGYGRDQQDWKRLPHAVICKVGVCRSRQYFALQHPQHVSIDLIA